MKHSDLDEIRICGREKKSKVDLSQLKGHLGNLGGKNEVKNWAYFFTFFETSSKGIIYIFGII